MSHNKLFEHQVIPQNSNTSPVENLAGEVAAAFDIVDTRLGVDTIYPSLNKVMGNFILTDLSYHGVTQLRKDTFSIGASTLNLSLSYIPTTPVVISYSEGSPGNEVITYLEDELSPVSLISRKTQFKREGRVITLGGNYAGKTLSVEYTGLDPALSGKNIKPNVLKMLNGVYLRPLVEASPTVFTVSYDINIQNNITKYFNGNTNNKDLVYLVAKKDSSYLILNYDSLTITNEKLTFTIDDGLEETYAEVLVYILNVTVADLLESLYLEFKNHDHSKSSFEAVIDHKNIINNYQNTDKISYKDSQTVNYLHPQFLNREGYNATLNAAYENAMLGDLFLSAVMTEEDQTFKSLTKESVKILFGDPIVGHKLYYNPVLKALNLLTPSNSNGLNIVAGTSAKALSINTDQFYITQEADKTAIKGKNNTIVITDDGTSTSLLETKRLQVNTTATLAEALVGELRLGNTRISSDGSNTSFNYIEESTSGKIFFKTLSEFDNVTINTGIIKRATLSEYIKTSDDSSLVNIDGKFSFDLKNSFLDINQSTGKTSGFQIGTNSIKQKLYSSDYQGGQGTSTDTSFYTETDSSSDVYFIKSTSTNLLYKNKTYSYKQDIAEGTRIDSLKDWIRSTVHVGDLIGYGVKLKASTAITRNGLVIGDTRISVVGSGLDCPAGTTIIESQDAVHLVKPLKEEDVECSSIAYQNFNTGSLQVFGDASFDSSLFIIGDVTTGETITASDLVINDTANISRLNVSGESSFSARAKFIGALDVQNNVSISGALELEGSVKASDASFEKFVYIGETLSVGGQAIFDDNMIVQGDFYTAQNFTTQGTLSAGDIKVGDVLSGSISAQGFIVAIGSLTAEGPTLLKGNLDTLGSIQANGAITTKGELTAESLYVTSDTTLIGRFSVDGVVNLATNSFTVGSTDASLIMYGNLQVAGSKSSFTGDIAVLGAINVSSFARFGSNVDITGDLSTVALSVNSNAVIRGTLVAQSGEFSKKVFMQDGFKTMGVSEFTVLTGTTITADDLTTKTQYIRDSLTMGPDAVVKASLIEGDKFLQKDAGSISSFKGEVEFDSEVRFSTEGIIVGDKAIKTTRNTAGCYITNNTITLGNNSTIQAVKIFAGKGTPSNGNNDRNAGYCFATSTAQGGQDGDTGFFATQPANLDGSNLEVWIDNSRKYVFYKQDVAFNASSEFGKAVVTLEMLQAALSNTDTRINSAVASTAASAWPPGSIYSTVNEGNPKVLIGFGTWVRFAAGRVLVGRELGSANETGGIISGGLTAPSGINLSATGTTFGSFTHKLTVNEIPSHNHNVKQSGDANNVVGISPGRNLSGTSNGNPVPANADAMDSVGGDQPHNNIQPSIVVNMWHRVA